MCVAEDPGESPLQDNGDASFPDPSPPSIPDDVAARSFPRRGALGRGGQDVRGPGRTRLCHERKLKKGNGRERGRPRNEQTTVSTKGEKGLVCFLLDGRQPEIQSVTLLFLLSLIFSSFMLFISLEAR